jgi:uncharacterized membrane protein
MSSVFSFSSPLPFPLRPMSALCSNLPCANSSRTSYFGQRFFGPFASHPREQQRDLVRLQLTFISFLSSLAAAAALFAQAPAPKPAPNTPQNTPAPSPTVPSPVSKHYPILIIAQGNEPSWSLRLGMKGPERLDRANYPPLVLDPVDVAREDSGTSWTYNAKDDATGANVAVKLTRELCSDAASDAKFTFRVEITHAQIGVLNGCGQSSPDKFPEFRKKNQIGMPDDADAKDKDTTDKDKDKKTVLDPITNFRPPVAVAYLDAAGRVIVSRSGVSKVAAPAGSELALSHDGKSLLYTRSDSKTGPERSIILYEVDTGRSREIAPNNARQPFWSPDDSRIAYLKFDGKLWQAWTAPANAPENVALFSPQDVNALYGWVNATTLLATDMQNAYWLSEDKPVQTVPLKEIYGDLFEIMSSDTVRVCPINPDLLLVSAYYAKTPAGAPTDAMGLNQSFFLYELRSKRRVVLGPPDASARNAEWSRDALQIFFTRGVPGRAPLVTDRLFWDGTNDKRYSSGNSLVVGK